jgi:hypothetical protein
MSVNCSPPADWAEFLVRFLFGALLGAAIGFSVWLRVFPFAAFGWIALPAGALLFGIIAARFGDAFWHSLRDWLWW